MRVLTMILAGGKGRRLFPLTRHRTKPAVPFGGNYRLIDFVLSNLVNSGLNAIYVLVQYRSQSLIEHLRTGWRGRGMTTDQFITVAPPQMRHGESWYRGSADAIRQNFNLVQTFHPDVLAVFAGDLVFRMDVRQLLDFHRRRRAEATVACAPVPLSEACGRLGVVRTEADGRITNFVEKPDQPEPMADRPDHAMASMGCFLFDPTILGPILEQLAAPGERTTDLSRDIFPQITERGRAYAYNFETNELSGVKPYERRGYWCDVGTFASYWSAHMDLLGAQPPFDLRNPRWPIFPARVNMPPTCFLSAHVEDSLVGEGGQIEGATIRRSVIGRGVTIEPGAVIEESVVMDHTHIGRGCHLCRAIVDRFNEVPAGCFLAPDAPSPDERCFLDRSAGLVVVPRGGIAPPSDEDYLSRGST
jgi:glucose-1-phosphate adenylyltransferase